MIFNGVKMIVGNWKMNLDILSARDFAEELSQFLARGKSSHEVVLGPSHTLLSTVVGVSGNIKIAAQNVSEFDNGAHTGEVSAKQLKSAGCDYVIVGHSERRQNNHETSQQVCKKAEQVADSGMLPIICVGETLTEREQGKTAQILQSQVSDSVPNDKLSKLIIAYEPVWAIGTGVVPTVGDIESAIQVIIEQLKLLKLFENNTVILYGGSVKSSNCQDIMEVNNVSGLLVGGASLQVGEFTKIIELLN